MELKIGDKVIGYGKHNEGIIREITAVRNKGYSWRYEDSSNEYLSENSSDPLFEMGWKKV